MQIRIGKIFKKIIVITAAFLQFFPVVPGAASVFKLGNVAGNAQIKFKPESFYLKNVNLLNRNNPYDKIILSRSTIDYNLDLFCQENRDSYEFFTSFRNKAVWGNPESIAQTTDSGLKLLEATFGNHKHFITRHILWIREMWFKFCINDAFELDFANQHYFTMGAFPFELGRGISLGSAFAVGPRVLGFYSDNAIDQYAFGFKFSGDLWKSYLNYDIYGAVLENKSDSLTNTAAKIRGQEFGRKFEQERGAGSVNFIVASRLRWFPINRGSSKLAFEPYAMYNYAPEQRVEINADANSKLGTIGLAGEWSLGNFECGFDTALNFGRQVVPGIDRNEIEFANDNGNVIIVNSRVHDTAATGPKTRYVPGSNTQKMINSAAESASQNGRLIGNVGGIDLYNDVNRFRNPSVNQYTGWMFITDGACKFKIGNGIGSKLALMAGVASGGTNPNQDLFAPNDSNTNTKFTGFIPLQELYSGNPNRVQSVFLLGGTGKAPRPLSIPVARDVIDRLPTLVSGFTNLVFLGSAFHLNAKYNDHAINLRPNLLVYWQQKATNAFDRITGASATTLARNYLGTEANFFFDAELFKECKIYLVSSMFVPGSHFTDIKGTPLNRDDLKALDQADKTGVIDDNNPRLSDNIAYTFNLGIECRF